LQATRLICLTCLLVVSISVETWQRTPWAHAEGSDNAMADQSGQQGSQSEQFLSLDQARQYMLGLINRDRKSVGSSPVSMDEIANTAGQLHSDEMAQFGYLAHWTMDGRKPDQRYTECGGKDTVMENVDGANTPNPPKLPLCQKQRFSKHDLEEVEGQYFNEKPPNDGHRVNIIDPNHTAVGIGLSVAGFEPGSEDGFPRMANTQEFINRYGTFSDIPQTIMPGDPLALQGTLDKGLHFDCIDLRWEKFPEPMTVEELDKTYSYSIPDEVAFSYFPPPFDSPAPVVIKEQDGCEHFSVEIQTTKQWKQGLYYVTVWVKKGNNKEAFGVSTRTFKFGANGSRGSHGSDGSTGPTGASDKRSHRLERPTGGPPPLN
jgi:uncharacterized protein YkwD